MKYQTIYREKNKKFNTNKRDILNTRGKIDVDIVDEEYHYTMDMDGFELSENLQDAFDTMEEREVRIIKNYHGFVDNPMTFDQISVLEKLSSGRVNQIYKMSLRKLRHSSRADRIREWVV